MLAMLDPTTLPIAISEEPLILAITFTISSGMLVPMLTIVRPITKSDTLYFLATEAEPATSQSAPFMSNTKPMAKSTYVIICCSKYDKTLLVMASKYSYISFDIY